MKRIILMTVILLMLSSACGGALDISEISEVDKVATIVAATMSVSSNVISTELPPSISPTEAVVAPEPIETTSKPTGTRVVYSMDGSIWLWEEGIDSRQLTNTGGGNVKISDDGQMIAFTYDSELWAVPADGGEAFQLVNQAYLDSVPRDNDSEAPTMFSSYEFIPGTHTLFFDLFLDLTALGGYPHPYGGLHRVNSDSPSPSQILLDGQSGVRYYSPDKQWVALSQPSHIAVMRVDGSEYRVVYDFDRIKTYDDWTFQPEVVWKSPSDGFYLALPASDTLDTPDDLGRFLYIGLDGRYAQLATFQSGLVYNALPRVSPDGTKVLYIKEVGEGREIRIVDASTADIHFIASEKDNLGVLGWADSDHFGFWYGDIGKPWYASVSEHSQRQLTDIYPTLNTSIQWLSDGRLIFEGGKELRISEPGSSSVVIDAPLTFLDFDVAE